MSLTVVAHFTEGKEISPFPSNIENTPGEGSFFPHPNPGNYKEGSGGIIMTAYDTEDVEFLVNSFKEHLKNNGLTLLCIHRVGDSEICYSETSQMLW